MFNKEKMSKECKSKSPSHWAYDKINECENIEEMKAIALLLVKKVEDEEIQFIFQKEMDADGYFEHSEEE
jgi:hypothetical protein